MGLADYKVIENNLACNLLFYETCSFLLSPHETRVLYVNSGCPKCIFKKNRYPLST